MKNGRLLLILLLCVFAFSSCTKDYSELIEGTWELDAKASYKVKNNKRQYFDEQMNDSAKFADYKCFAEFDDGEVFFYSKEPNGEKKYTRKYHLDKDCFYIDGVKNTIIKLNDSKLVFECRERNELIHYEFDNMYYRPFLSDWLFWICFIWTIVVFVAVAVGSFRGYLGWVSNPPFNDFDNTQVNESLSDENIQMVEKCKFFVDKIIESDEGMNSLCDKNDAFWQQIKDSSYFSRKLEDREVCVTCGDEELVLPDGEFFFEGGLTRAPRIYNFVNSKGSTKELRRWLRTKEGLDWQNSADGLIWTRDQVFISNCNSHARKKQLKSKKFWTENLKESLIWSLISSLIGLVVFIIVEGNVFKRVTDGTFAEYIKDISLINACVIFSVLYVFMFLFYALFFISGDTAFRFISPVLAEKWFQKPIIRFKVFSRRVHAVNKAENVTYE